MTVRHATFSLFHWILFRKVWKLFCANAREIRKLAEQIIFNQNIRVSEIPKSKRTDEYRKALLMRGIKSIKREETEK